MYISCLGVPLTINAYAQTENYEDPVTAIFNSSVDTSNILVGVGWEMRKDDFSRVSTSKIMELENFVKKQTKNKYDLIYVINVAMYDSSTSTYLDEVNGLQHLNIEMDFDGEVIDGYCVVAHLDTHKTQSQLMALNETDRPSLLSNATNDSLTYYPASSTVIEGEHKFNLSFDTNRDGVYLIFQIDTTFFDAQNLFLIIGLAVIIAILILLVIIVIRVIKNKRLQEVQERIRTNGDSYLSSKKGKMDLDKDEIQKNNLTRKVPLNKPKTTNSQSMKKVVPELPKASQTTKIAPKLPSKPQNNIRNNGEE